MITCIVQDVVSLIKNNFAHAHVASNMLKDGNVTRANGVSLVTIFGAQWNLPVSGKLRPVDCSLVPGLICVAVM